MTTAYRFRWFGVALILASLTVVTMGQSGDRQIPVKVTAKPRNTVFVAGEPILIDIEIYNGLKAEIIVQGYSVEPNDWNGETTAIQLPDIYRLPLINQNYLKRPELDSKMMISSPGGRRVGPNKSLTKTIDASKWTIVDGWTKGKYQVLIRIDKIDVDKYTWISVHSDPVFFEIR